MAAAVGPAALTPRERDVASAVLAFRRANGGGNPTVRELAAAVGVTQSTAYEIMGQLRAKGVMAWGTSPRTIRLVHLDGRA